jgi:hypothetical protein
MYPIRGPYRFPEQTTNKTNKQIRGTPWEYFLQSCVVQADVSEAETLSASKQNEKFVFAALHI